MSESNFFDFAAPAGGVVGQPLDRIDGRAKVTGAARYSAEYPLGGLTYGVFSTSSIAKGRIASIDTTLAMKEPGVLAVFTHLNLPKLAKMPDSPERNNSWSPGQSFLPLMSDEIFYSGQPVALVVADTFERATHAASLVRVSYQAEKPVAGIVDPRAEVYEAKAVQGGRMPGRTRRGNPQAALEQAPVRVTATYTHAMNHHNPMEPSATTAVWEGDRLTVYESTQGVTMTQSALSDMLGLPRDKVRVVTQFLGGGFGCKGSSWPHTVLTAQAARAVGRPVKLVLTRRQMFTSVGHREDQRQTITLGATKEGKLTAILHEKTSSTSMFDEWAESNGKVISMLYECPNFETSYKIARANIMTSTYTRAPGEAPGTFAIECAMDDLAYQLGIDPLEIRLRNYAERDPSNGQPWSSKSLKQCYARGAELFGWSKRNPKAGATRDGRYLVGMGMASATYPVHNSQGMARVRIFSDGHAVVQSGATDMGVGTYTVMTQVAADALGLPVERVRFELGDTTLPTAPLSGGSVTAGTVSSAIFMAAQDAKRKVLELASGNKTSPLFGAKPEDITVENGRVFLTKNPAKGETYATMLEHARLTDIEGSGAGRYGGGYTSPGVNADSKGQGTEKYSMHSFGAHFCEVHVDPELGRVRVTRWVGVHAAGRILNAKTARSQVLGGAIFGIGAALMEATHRDPSWVRYTNADLGDYHIPVSADIPDMQVEFIDEHDSHINAMGVKGIGEIAMVGVAAAVANAIFHATGRRVRELPITPEKLMGAGSV
ncbi:xanthine dehydrogenase family protein molybdopterin-binding subunit [Hymenobacter sp. BT491]|uniref:xanthine dehydrogenase family protein molybdopterin-binding subunit n=1 Tax=Hymenobacter sp. BT491 TaxID=2766779 RepID=UPI0016534C06|nr:xanthine dehydrogenase family protein molybdopterin-binding subunit [Hymenobacter sp. BT491]MBC6989071.1 xanthine dehydrogenase family protein molybdopterin-binding subunit [Hymenobacter sp. BT491]